MLVRITYDVNTKTAAGRKRLWQVAKQCVNYGQRVQCSVFECSLDEAKFRQVQHKLLNIIDLECDSLRFYNLGDRFQNRVEHYGAKPFYDAKGTLMI